MIASLGFNPLQTLTRLVHGETVQMHRCRVCCRMRSLLGQRIVDEGYQPIDEPLQHLPGCPLYAKPPLLPIHARAVVMCPVSPDHEFAGATGVIEGYTDDGLVRLRIDQPFLRHLCRRRDPLTGRPIAVLRPESLALAGD
jgi:hypothetical protein